jgi:lipoprotein-releasing system permease protein
MPFELFLALRYLRPKRTYVSVITLISIIGVMLAVAVLCIVISVMTGFDRQLRDKILGFNAHVRVCKLHENLHEYEEIMSVVSANAMVKGVAPYVLGPVLVETQPLSGTNSRVMAPYLRGIDPDLEGNVSLLPRCVKEGAFDVSGSGILVGRVLADALHLHVGDPLAIYSVADLKQMKESRGEDGEVLIPPKDYTVKGIFEVGYYEYDASLVVCSLVNAQELYGLGDDVNGLLVILHDPFKAAEARRLLRAALGESFVLSTWAEENRSILNALAVEKNVMFYILFFIMLVAAFGIMGTLIAFVVQKTREIGILKAVGASNGQVALLFLSQSVLVGVLGVGLGYGLGMLALAYRNEFLRFMNSLTGFELFPAEIYSFNELPAQIVRGDIAIICGIALLMCVLAGVLPAWNAGRLKPVEALRHE